MSSRVLIVLAALLLGAVQGLAQEEGSLPEEDLLVLEVRLAGQTLADDLVAFGHPEGVLLPLQRLAELLELPLEVDPEGGVARGWIAAEERRASFDLGHREWALGHRTGRFEPAMAQGREGDLFLDADLLSVWLPIDFAVDRGALVLAVVPREKLALQERWEREARRRDLRTARAGEGAPAQSRFAFEPHPYGLVGWPTIDGSVGFSLGFGEAGRTTSLHHSFLARGDLLAMTAGLFVSGDEARLTLERTLGGSEWKIGDLALRPDPLVSRGRAGRGLLIAGAPVPASAASFERTVLAGDALPGWEVELYRNGALLDFQRVGEDGRYELRDIPLRNGMNLFRLSFYGSHGERREREERIFFSHDLLPAGETSWRLGVVQAGAGLVGAASAAVSGDDVLSGGRLGSFELERGLSRHLSWGLGLTSLALDEARHEYLGFNLRTSWPGGSGQLRLTRDLRGGWAGELQARGSLGPVQFEADQVELQDFRGDGEETGDIRSRTRLRLFTQASLPKRFFKGAAFPVSLTGTRRVTASGEGLLLQATSAFALPVGPSTLGNRWRLDFSDGDLSAGGALLWSARLRKLGLRGDLSYGLAPEPVLSDLTLQAETTMRQDLTARLGLSQNLGQAATALSAGVDWRRDRVLLGLRLGLTSRGRVELGASLSFSLGHDPQKDQFRIQGEAGASQGAVSARVFLDADNNGRFGPGDSPLPGVRFEADAGALAAVTGDDGLAWVRIPPYRPVSLSISEKSLADPAWIPGRSGVSLVPRPGVAWTADFPVVVTGEIEGMVFLRDGESRREASNVRVQLVDAQGTVLQESRSQFDGFYLFERVLPGRYSIRIDPAQLERLRLTAAIEKPELELRSGESPRRVEIVLLPLQRIPDESANQNTMF
ncbi:MAG TPA: hypothetical protein VMW27_30750 [Thermoanaerobaculia bacterium]|nr:hypothetical protein [Thermoanaerobaculia bacterium]